VSLERVLHGERDKIIIEREANGRLAKLGGSRWRERAHNMTKVMKLKTKVKLTCLK
jgi:hypothetical protein